LLARFSLYGFLKNQQYFEPFLLLALIDIGLSYTMIGILIGVREVLRNVAEVPSGAIADVLGRRRSLLFSFACYIVSFAVTGSVLMFAGETSTPVIMTCLIASFGFYALGDAFRSGTHKALIFAWLHEQGRTEERTRIYGYTRSWSKLGSALAVILACLFVYVTDNYAWIFFLSILPFIANMLNVGTYPEALDGERDRPAAIAGHLKESFGLVMDRPRLRALIVEAMSFEGYFKAAKDYLQPVLQIAAIPLAAVLFVNVDLSDAQASIVLIGPVYVLLFLGSAFASRQAHRFVDWSGSPARAAALLWILLFAVFSLLLPGLYMGIAWLAITMMVALHLLQNLWRPIFVSRVDEQSDERKGATILSIQTQAQSLATMVFAPVLGYFIDALVAGSASHPFWPVAAFGMALSLVFVIRPRPA
jgi:MFS family permease